MQETNKKQVLQKNISPKYELIISIKNKEKPNKAETKIY